MCVWERALKWKIVTRETEKVVRVSVWEEGETKGEGVKEDAEEEVQRASVCLIFKCKTSRGSEVP